MRATASEHRRRSFVLQVALGTIATFVGARWFWKERPANLDRSFTAPPEVTRAPAWTKDVKATASEFGGGTGRGLLNKRCREVNVEMEGAGACGHGPPALGAPSRNAVRMKKYIPLSERPIRNPRGQKKKVMMRMPDTLFSTEDMMRRIMTVMIKNMGEMYHMNGPMKTIEVMKCIGLQGFQIKTKKYINKALYTLYGMRMILLVKQSPKRWELHPEYWEHGVPKVSLDENDPWKYAHLIKFLPYWETSKRFKRFGPIHGRFHEDQQEEMMGIKPGDEWWPPGSKTHNPAAEEQVEPGDETYTR